MAGIKESEPEVAALLLPPPEAPAKDGDQAVERITPWRGFLRSGPVRRFLRTKAFSQEDSVDIVLLAS